jgi:CHAT domain-containing protein/tetratricopeptide (TPR) repeat protein
VSDTDSMPRGLEAALSAVEMALGDPTAAAAHIDAAAAAGAGHPEVGAVLERARGLLRWARGEHEAALVHLRSAVAAAESAGLTGRAGEARGSLGLVLMMTGDGEGAVREIDRALPDVAGVPAARLRMLRALVLAENGDLPAAAAGYADAETALRAAGGDPLVEADLRTNRSILLAQQRNWADAERDLAAAERLYTSAGQPARTAMVQHNRALAAAARGDVPQALRLFDDAEHRYRSAGRDVGMLPVEKADVLLTVGLVAEARSTVESAVREYIHTGNATDLAHARLLLAEAALAGGAPAVAATEARLATRAYRRQHRPGWAVVAAHVGLRATEAVGPPREETLRIGRHVARALAAAGWSARALDARLVVARTALALGRVAEARSELADAAAARSDGAAGARARAWHAQALLRLAEGDRAGAERALRAGIGVLERFRAGLGATELRASAAGEAGELATLGARLALADGRPAAVLSWAERWRASALRLRSALPPEDPALRDDLAELRQVVSAVAEAATAGRSTAAVLRRQAQLEASVRMRSRHAGGGRAERTDKWSVADLRRLLGDAALVEYLVLDGRLHAVVVAARRTSLHDLGPVDDVARRIDELRFALRRLAYAAGSSTTRTAAAVERSAARVDALLLAPLELSGGELVVVPTGVLHGVPWPVMPSCDGRAVSVSPSAALWCRAARRGRSGSATVLAAGPRLEHADAEIDALAMRYPDAIRLVGPDAAVPAVTAALDGAAVAHLAAHGRLRTDNPLFSALEFADGPLTVHDLERLTEPPDLVVLSACDAGRSDVLPGDELLGLASALLAMGTRTLVAAVLPVDDGVTGELMVGLHRQLTGGQGPAVALAAARAELPPERAYRAAGFLCFGAG